MAADSGQPPTVADPWPIPGAPPEDGPPPTLADPWPLTGIPGEWEPDGGLLALVVRQRRERAASLRHDHEGQAADPGRDVTP